MVKSWSRLCFLVLAISSLSRGQNETVAPPQANHSEAEDSSDLLGKTPAPLSVDDATGGPTSPTVSPQSNTTVNATDLPQTYFKPTEEGHDQANVTTTKEDNGTAPQTRAPVPVPGGSGEDDKTVVTTPATILPTQETPEEPEKDSSSWGYALLVLIILVIIALSVILYMLRRVSRTYSFDLQRPVPVNDVNEPTGTFGAVYLDDLDQTAPKEVTTDDLSPPPVTNGTTLQSEEKASNGENAPQEQPEPNGVESSPAGNTSPSLGDDLADTTSSPLTSSDLLLDAIGDGQQNENNNNPSVCSSDPFVEINLDDPAWCDQLLASPEAPSSVLPFSPFSFSSSSSSSSS